MNESLQSCNQNKCIARNKPTQNSLKKDENPKE